MNPEFASLLHLSVPERIQLVEDLWDSIGNDADSLPVPDWQKQELARREADLQRDPSLVKSWEQVKESILSRHGG